MPSVAGPGGAPGLEDYASVFSHYWKCRTISLTYQSIHHSAYSLYGFPPAGGSFLGIIRQLADFTDIAEFYHVPKLAHGAWQPIFEPSVQLYTTPRHVNFFEITCQLRLTDTSGVIIVTFTLHRVLRDTTPRYMNVLAYCNNLRKDVSNCGHTVLRIPGVPGLDVFRGRFENLKERLPTIEGVMWRNNDIVFRKKHVVEKLGFEIAGCQKLPG